MTATTTTTTTGDAAAVTTTTGDASTPVATTTYVSPFAASRAQAPAAAGTTAVATTATTEAATTTATEAPKAAETTTGDAMNATASVVDAAPGPEPRTVTKVETAKPAEPKPETTTTAAAAAAAGKKDDDATEKVPVKKAPVKKAPVKRPAGEGGAKATGTRLAKKKARKRGDATTSGADAAQEANRGPAKKKPKTKNGEVAAKFTKKDWVCKCGFNNFSKNTACHKCKAAKPARVGRNAAEDYLAAWALMERTEVDPVHHQYLLKQVGISSELREEFFEFFVQYCASMTKTRRKKMLAGAMKAHQRLGQILEALGGNADDDDSDSESESADDDETTAAHEATTPMETEAAAAPAAAAPAEAQAKRKKRGNRGKKGRGAKSASAVAVPATPAAQETTA